MTIVHCLYCLRQTGSYETPADQKVQRFIVCSRCHFENFRDERREVEAGMRPWARPAIGYYGRSMPDEEAAELQNKWDAEQAEISARNLARQGGIER